MAQVHLAQLPNGTEVAVKVLRPAIASVIANDLALMPAVASVVERLWKNARRLRSHAVAAEFSKHLENELDLMREAASASQLRRNFEGSPHIFGAVIPVHLRLELLFVCLAAHD